MTTRERFLRTLTGKPVDRVPFMKVFGGTNAVIPRWERERPGIGAEIDRLLRFEGTYRGWDTTGVNFWLSRCGAPVVLSENEERRVERSGDGTVKILTKGGDYHQHTVEWPVKSRADWDRIRAEHLRPDDPERFPANWPARLHDYRDRDYPLQLTHGGVYGFARNLMGDERLLYSLYDDPSLVHDIMDGYTEVVLAIWGKMVGELSFDLIEFWEDMASKNGPFLSPAMFREFMLPNYRRVAEFAARHGIEILLVDSDGYTDELAALLVEGGVNALYPFEVGAGCSVERSRAAHPRLGIIGGLDKQAMAEGKTAVDSEMEKARRFIRLGRFIPGPDHFALSNVSFEQYRYFMERLRETVMTTSPSAA